MDTQTFDPTQTQTPRTASTGPATVVSPVGTFASGQSAHGSFRVAVAADVGSFAAGLATPPASATA